MASKSPDPTQQHRVPTWARGLQPDTILDRMARFDDARPRIKVRLHPEDYLRHPDAPRLVLEKIADGIAALLVCDLGYANVSVPRSVLQAWGKPREELFRLAITNVRGEGPLFLNRSIVPCGPTVDLLYSESNYAASHALFFEDYVKDHGRYGALIGVPQRHVLVRHVIRDKTVIPAMAAMLQVIDDWYAEGPGPISRQLYWWRPGKLVRVPSRRRRGAVVITPTPELQAAVLHPIVRGN